MVALRSSSALVAHPDGPEFGAKDTKANDELFEYTRQRSTPVIWWADERPRSAWTEQLYLIERVAKELGVSKAFLA